MKPDDNQSPNGKRKTVLIIAISLMIGFGGGWFSFRSKEIIEWYRIRNIMYEVGLSDEDLNEMFRNMPEMESDIDELIEDMDAGAQRNAVVSLVAFKQIEAGEIERVKKILAGQVASYYFIYGPPGDPEKNISEEAKMLNRIQEAMEESPFLKAEINKGLADKEK